MAKKYIDADRLKAEITKHYDEYKAKFHQNGERYYLGLIDGIEMTERILDSLQQEQPDAEALKREWWNKGYYEGRKNAHIPAKELGLPKAWDFQQEQPCDTCTNDKGCVTCKDGELWEGKEQSSEWEGQRTWIEQPSEELEAEIKRYRKEEMPVVLESDLNDIARHFAEWQKEQVLKDAVEGEVYRYESYQRIATAILVDIPRENLGDKVKVVIIPIKEGKE